MPTAIKYPGHITPGITIDSPTSQMDIFPTFLTLAGVDTPKDRIIDGIDMMPALKQELSVSPHRFLFHYCCTQVHSIRYTPEKGEGF